LTNILKKSLPLLLMLCLIIVVYAFDLNTYVTLDNLKKHDELLPQFTDQYFWLSSGILIDLYCIVTALTLPLSAPATINSGYLFAIAWGALLVALGAHSGAPCLFISVR